MQDNNKEKIVQETSEDNLEQEKKVENSMEDFKFQDFPEDDLDINEPVKEMSQESKIRSEVSHAAIIGYLKIAKPMMIVGWVLSVIMIGLIIVQITCVIIGMQFIRRQNIQKGLLMIFFGIWTLGIWPYIEAKKILRTNEVEYIDYDSVEYKASLLKGYKYGFILALIATLTLVFIVGLIILPVACYFVAVQHIREGRLVYAICMVLFGGLTFGLWPIFDSYFRREKLKKEILLLSL